MSRRVTIGVFGAMIWMLAAGEGRIEAQSPDLTAVRVAMEEARFPEARELLESWWESGGERAERRSRQEALWLRAQLTPDPEVAELDYRRLVVEFPGGPFSDGALLRLAQAAEARGELDSARGYLQILVRDYPTSEHRVEARDRMVRIGEAAGSVDEPARTSPTPARTDSVIDPVIDPVIDSVTAAAADTVPLPDSIPVDVPDPVDAEVEEPTGEFTIQLGAFSTRERALDVAARAGEAGLEVRVVQVDGSALFRVRWGAFESRDAADSAAGDARELGFEALVSSDREAERTPGG